MDGKQWLAHGLSFLDNVNAAPLVQRIGMWVGSPARPRSQPGSYYNPAASCNELAVAHAISKDGTYWLRQAADGAKPYLAYCDMTTDG